MNKEIVKTGDQKVDPTLVSSNFQTPFIGSIEVLPLIPDCPGDEVPHVQIINGVQVGY